MTPELDKQLCDKYPKIFSDRYKSPQESCLAFGIECGDGWYEILDTLCYAATHTWTTSIKIDEEDAKKLLIEKSKYNDCYYLEIPAPTMVAAQVKEKFGTLRFYYDLELEPNIKELHISNKYPDLTEVVDRHRAFFDGIIHMAEIMSERTCEKTGKKGEMCVRGGWYKVLCEEKAKEFEYTPCRLIKRDEVI